MDTQLQCSRFRKSFQRLRGMGKVPKVTLMIQRNVDGIWKKLPAPMSANGRRREIALEGVSGVFLGGAVESGTQIGNRVKIDDAIEQYLTDTRAQQEDGTYRV